MYERFPIQRTFLAWINILNVLNVKLVFLKQLQYHLYREIKTMLIVNVKDLSKFLKINIWPKKQKKENKVSVFQLQNVWNYEKLEF